MHANVLETASHRQHGTRERRQVAVNCMARYLDEAIPLQDASHADVVHYSVETIWRKAECIATLTDGRRAKLHDAWQFIGYRGRDSAQRLLFRSNGLHIEVQIDAEQLLVAAEANDSGYFLRNWFGFLRSTLAAMPTGSRTSRPGRLNKDRLYTTVDGGQISLAACSA